MNSILKSPLNTVLYGLAMAFCAAALPANASAAGDDFAGIDMGTRSACRNQSDQAVLGIWQPGSGRTCYSLSTPGVIEIDYDRYKVELGSMFDLTKAIDLSFAAHAQNIDRGAWLRTVVRCRSGGNEKTYRYTNAFYGSRKDLNFAAGECRSGLSIENYSDYGREIFNLEEIDVYGTYR